MAWGDTAFESYPRETQERIMSECHHCANRRAVPGDCHIGCARPDAAMVGNPHGIRKGWFMYPLVFDPVWKMRLCGNFQSDAISPAISRPVSDAVSLQHDG